MKGPLPFRRRMGTIVLVALAFFSPLAALPATAGIPVRGAVVEADSSPAAGVSVALFERLDDYEQGVLALESGSLTGEPVATAASGADGRFELEAPGPGFFRAEIRSPGRVPIGLEVGPLVDETELPTARLAAARTAALRAADPAGEPLAGARVYALAEPPLPEGPLRVTARSRGRSRSAREWTVRPQLVTTDAKGRGRLHGFSGGVFQLQAIAAGHQAVQLADASGDRLVAALEPALAVEVTVTDEAGRPLAGALLEAGRPGVPVALTDEAGRASFPGTVGEPVAIELLAADGRRLAGSLVAELAEDGSVRGEQVSLPAPRTIGGWVVDADSGRPVAGGLVWHWREPGRWAESDAEGRFTLVLPSVRSAVFAQAPGYFQGWREGAEGGGDLRIELEPSVHVSGRVVDADGVGLAGAAIARGASDGRLFRPRPGAAAGLTRTDAEGRFTFRQARPKEVLELLVALDGYAPTTARMTVPREGLAGVEIELLRGRSGFGRVADLDDRPIAGATVRLFRAEWASFGYSYRARSDPGESGFSAVTGEDGVFRLDNLPPGRWDLSVRASGFAPLAVPGLEIPDGEGGHDLGTVQLEPGAVIDGRVVDADGRPVAGAAVEMNVDLLGRFQAWEGPDPGVVTDAEGRFAIVDLRPAVPVGLHVRADGFAGRMVEGVVPPLDEPLEIELATASQVSGRVRDAAGSPVAEATVVFWSKSEGAGRASSTSVSDRTDAEGRFAFADVVPGPAVLLAEHAGTGSAQQDILVVAGRQAEGVEIVLRRSVWVVGRVAAPDGTPLPRVTLFVEEGESRVNRTSSLTDDDGRYEIDVARPGRFRIEAFHATYRRLAREVELLPGENRVDLEMPAGVEVAGAVRTDDGSPVAGAQVTLVPSGGGRFEVEQPYFDQADAGGEFRFPYVREGEYSVSASKEGLAAARLPEPLAVGTAPVSGVELVLERGGSVFGKVLGLDLPELGRVSLTTSPVDPSARLQTGSTARVRHDGSYRIDGLAAGTWRVSAHMMQPMRFAHEIVEILGNGHEVEADLVFADGLTLSGVVLERGAPVAGARVHVMGTERLSIGGTVTDQDGRFTVRGLQPGPHTVSLHLPERRIEQRESVDLTTDQEITLTVAAGRLSGRVVDAGTGDGIAGAQILLFREASFERWTPAGMHASGEGGFFEIADVPAGRFRLRVSRDGFATAESEVTIYPEVPTTDQLVRLEAANGFVLRVVGVDGRPARQIRAALLDGSGRAVLSGRFHSPGDGLFELSGAPAGSWELLVAGDHATGSVTITVPAGGQPDEPPVIALPRSTSVRVRVPALESDDEFSTLRVFGADGRPYRWLDYTGFVVSEDRLLNGRAGISLPEGVWTARVTTPAGEEFAGSATVAGGVPVELVLE